MLCIRNGLIADGIASLIVKKNNEVKLFEERQTKLFNNSAILYQPDVIVIEIKGIEPYTVHAWQERIKQVKKDIKNCKIAMIVDDDNYPEVTLLVKAEKANGCIDAFFYASSGLNYLVDAIDSL